METPAVNLKCIVFTIVLAAGYWFLPHRNKYVLLALFYFPYLALAWYDWYADCDRNLGPTYLANFYWWAKPPESRQVVAYKNWSPRIKAKIALVDLIVILVAVSMTPWFLRL